MFTLKNNFLFINLNKLNFFIKFFLFIFNKFLKNL